MRGGYRDFPPMYTRIFALDNPWNEPDSYYTEKNFVEIGIKGQNTHTLNTYKAN